MAATLEHRFFGESFPIGFSQATLTTLYAQASTNVTVAKGLETELVTITLVNVLLDSVAFVDWIKSNVTGCGRRQGGNYWRITWRFSCDLGPNLLSGNLLRFHLFEPGGEYLRQPWTVWKPIRIFMVGLGESADADKRLASNISPGI
jgi:hypothetical protein